MKRNFVFVWGPEVQAAVAALSAPKIAQLRACCIALIARAEHYRQNPMLLVRIVEMPHLTDEDLPWAPFKMFGMWFKLDCFEKGGRRYVLNFATPPEPEPPACAAPDASGPARGTKSARRGARQARVRRPPKATDRRNLFISYKTHWKQIWRSVDPPGGQLSSTLAHSLRRIAGVGGGLFGRMGVLRRRLGDFASSVAQATRRIRASFRFHPSLVGVRFGPEARLEPRMFGRDSGLPILLYTLVWDDEPVDWSAYLFGEPCREGD